MYVHTPNLGILRLHALRKILASFLGGTRRLQMTIGRAFLFLPSSCESDHRLPQVINLSSFLPLVTTGSSLTLCYIQSGFAGRGSIHPCDTSTKCSSAGSWPPSLRCPKRAGSLRRIRCTFTSKIRIPSGSTWERKMTLPSRRLPRLWSFIVLIV